MDGQLRCPITICHDFHNLQEFLNFENNKQTKQNMNTSNQQHHQHTWRATSTHYTTRYHYNTQACDSSVLKRQSVFLGQICGRSDQCRSGEISEGNFTVGGVLKFQILATWNLKSTSRNYPRKGERRCLRVLLAQLKGELRCLRVLRAKKIEPCLHNEYNNNITIRKFL